MKLSSSFSYIVILLIIFIVDNVVSVLMRKEVDPLLQKKVLGGYIFDMKFIMPAGPIFAKGWLKYTTYDVDETSKPREFFKNFAFYDQFKHSETLNLNSKDKV